MCIRDRFCMTPVETDHLPTVAWLTECRRSPRRPLESVDRHRASNDASSRPCWNVAIRAPTAGCDVGGSGVDEVSRHYAASAGETGRQRPVVRYTTNGNDHESDVTHRRPRHAEETLASSPPTGYPGLNASTRSPTVAGHAGRDASWRERQQRAHRELTPVSPPAELAVQSTHSRPPPVTTQALPSRLAGSPDVRTPRHE